MPNKVTLELVEDNTANVLNEIPQLKEALLTMWGKAAASYARDKCPVGTPESTGIPGYIGGTLKNSIHYSVNTSDGYVEIGSAVKYAPYVELGTGPNYEPPPEWLENGAEKGNGVPGVGYVRARPFLRPAITEHLNEYNDMLLQVMKQLEEE